MFLFWEMNQVKSVWKTIREIMSVICVFITLTMGIFCIVHWDAVQKIGRTAILMQKTFLGEIEEKKVVDGIVAGMLSGLDDKYTVYLPEDSTKRMMQQVSGNVYGIGVYVSENEQNQIVLVGTMPESPAEEAGIQAGDVLVSVDGKSVKNMTVDEAVAMMRGAGNTMVTVGVERKGIIYSFDVKRYKIGTVKTVAGTILEDYPEIAYMRIYSFTAQTAVEFAEVANGLRESGYQAMILDLRNNGGGEVNAAINLARVFVDRGPIVHVVYGNGKKDTKNATGSQLQIPLVVLVNENTASASEIFSAAVKESGSGVLLGTRTFGKGLVQGVYFYKDGSAVKITEAKYLTPNQNDINGVGIAPDIMVEQTEANEDAQLAAAIRYLIDKAGIQR